MLGQVGSQNGPVDTSAKETLSKIRRNVEKRNQTIAFS